MLHFTESDVPSPSSDGVRPPPDAGGIFQAGRRARRRTSCAAPSCLHNLVPHYMVGADASLLRWARSTPPIPKHGADFPVIRAEDARPLAMLEANYLGQIGIGAASGIATDLLARSRRPVPCDSRLALSGAQPVGKRCVPFAGSASVRVYSRSAEKRQRSRPNAVFSRL